MFSIKLRYLSYFSFLIAIATLLNIFNCYYLNLYLNLNTYFISFIVSIFIGLLFYKAKNMEKNNNIFNKILTIIIGFVLFPAVLSLPFYLSIYNLSFINSFFEAISGFSSTGFTIFENVEKLENPLIVWRSFIQWIGGLYFLFSIIFLIDLYDDNFKKTLTNYILINNSEILNQIFKILILYTSLTIIIFLILNIFEISFFNSLNLAMTIISSGGFLPVNDFADVIINEKQKIILSLLMLISFFSIFFTYNLFIVKNKNIDFFYEDIHLLVYLIFLILFFYIFLNFNDNFTNIFLVICTSVSNIGISDTLNNVSYNFILLILVIIGGSFFSTSSGIHFVKIYSLFNYSLNQILSFSKPKYVFKNKLFFTKISFDFNEINKYFLSILMFILSFFFLCLLLSLSGIEFEEVFKLSILTLTNTVNSSAYGLAEFNFENLNFFTKFYLIFFMIIGRIGFLSFLLILKKFLFKN
ncbi:MAG: TrkH family potassium uptake protein [Pelagibacteraceae bacterium]|nr:TrkH family potassium uptake protein [Pelagibacteraceae bacterium]